MKSAKIRFPKDSDVLRYDDKQVISTDLDPIEDILNLISSLKSTGFTSDLLKEVHHFSDANEIKKTSKLISLHISNAIGLAEQAFSGPSESSFLPLYYSTLNLSKVYLLTRDKRKELELNRWHGATYNESEMRRNFLNEKIQVKKRGTISLLFNLINKNKISKTGLTLKIDDIYQNIISVGAEYSTITKKKLSVFSHASEIVKDDENGHFLRINNVGENFQHHIPSPRKIKAYSGLKLKSDDEGKEHYETKRIKGDYENVKVELVNNINRNLISDYYHSKSFPNRWISLTPINGRAYVSNEDLSIMLAYFHLSNVVRYNPEHLYKLMDSRYWPILLSLRKHGFLRFEKLMWGNFLKKSFDIA